jgi:GT2 family glycosyltransferase
MSVKQMESGKMRISIVILNWRQAELTCSCLDSLFNAACLPCDVIVLDNNSLDGSADKITARFPQVEMIENRDNRGFGAGNNPGIRRALASGADFIWLLNNDTVVDGDTLPAMLKVMKGNPKAGIVGSVLYSMRNPGEFQTFGGYKLNLERCYVLPCGFGEKPDFITGASMLLRREALLEAGLFDEKFFMYWEDADLCMRIRRCGWDVAVAGDSKVLHLEGAYPKLRFKIWRYATFSALRFSWRYSPCPLRTLLIGFLYDRLLAQPLKCVLTGLLRILKV